MNPHAERLIGISVALDLVQRLPKTKLVILEAADEIERIERANRLLRTALVKAEWSTQAIGNGYAYICPACYAMQKSGHAPSCLLRHALTETEGL